PARRARWRPRSRRGSRAPWRSAYCRDYFSRPRKTGVVVTRDAEEQLVEHLPALGVERREEVVLDLLHDRAQAAELRLAGWCQRDGVAAAIVGIPAALDQAPLFEAVEEADELAAVELQRVGDR